MNGHVNLIWPSAIKFFENWVYLNMVDILEHKFFISVILVANFCGMPKQIVLYVGGLLRGVAV